MSTPDPLTVPDAPRSYFTRKVETGEFESEEAALDGIIRHYMDEELILAEDCKPFAGR